LDNPRFLIRKVAVLGAGVMGAQIAAHLVNANIETLLFELPADEKNPNANVVKAIEKLTKQEPSPLSIKQKASFIQPANGLETGFIYKSCATSGRANNFCFQYLRTFD
jgi:3-hydroxyacyl-CoA dehydrogenase